MCARTSSPRPALRLVTNALYTATAPPDTTAQVPYLNTMITVYVHCATKTVDQRAGGSALTVARRTGNTLRVEAGLASLSRRGSNELGIAPRLEVYDQQMNRSEEMRSVSSATIVPHVTAHAGIVWLLRLILTINVALFVLQGFTGGEYFVGEEEAITLHGAFAVAIHIATGIQTLAAAWLWRIYRAPLWPVLLSAIAFAVSFGQAALGSSGTLNAHLPLALVLLVLVVLVLAWAWARPIRGVAGPQRATTSAG